MRRAFMLAPVVCGVALAVAVAGDLKSGPQVGGSVAAFHPLNVTGDSAGQKACLV